MRYRESVRLILNVSSHELTYDARARSTPDIGHVVSAGIVWVVLRVVIWVCKSFVSPTSILRIDQCLIRSVSDGQGVTRGMLRCDVR